MPRPYSEIDLWSEPTPTFRRLWFHFYHNMWLCLKMRDLPQNCNVNGHYELSTTLNNSHFVFSMWSVFVLCWLTMFYQSSITMGNSIFQFLYFNCDCKSLYSPISWPCFFWKRLQVDQTITMSCPAAVDVAFCAFTVQATRPAVSTADRRFSWFNHLTWIYIYIYVYIYITIHIYIYIYIHMDIMEREIYIYI